MSSNEKIKFFCASSYLNLILGQKKDNKNPYGQKKDYSQYKVIHDFLSIFGDPGWEEPTQFQDTKGIVSGISDFVKSKTKTSYYIPFDKEEYLKQVMSAVSSSNYMETCNRVTQFLADDLKVNSIKNINEIGRGLRYLLIQGTDIGTSFVYGDQGERIIREDLKQRQSLNLEKLIIAGLVYIIEYHPDNTTGSVFYNKLYQNENQQRGKYLYPFSRATYNFTIDTNVKLSDISQSEPIDITDENILMDFFVEDDPALTLKIKNVSFNINKIELSGNDNKINLYVEKQIINNGKKGESNDEE